MFECVISTYFNFKLIECICLILIIVNCLNVLFPKFNGSILLEYN